MKQGKWNKRFWIFFWGLLAFRASMVFLLPLDLSPDEAYYWEWSRRIAWGYYSKPPLVAWVIWLFSHAAGDCTACIRLAATLCASLATLFTYLLARSMYGEKTGFWAALLSAAVPASAVLALVITIDAPPMAFWGAALYRLWRSVEDRPAWWAATGLAAGLAMLAKQTAVAFWPLAFLFLAVSPQHRRLLRSPAPYLSAALSLLMLVPTLAWNMDHGWITLRHTEHHFKGLEGGVSLSPSSALEFLLSQAGIISPLIWAAVWAAMLKPLAKASACGARERFLLVFSLPPLAGITLLSLFQRVNANWPAPFYTTAVILAAAWLAAREGRPSSGAVDAAFRPSVTAATGALLTLLLYAAGFAGNMLPIDPAYRLRGWKESAAAIEAAIQRLPHQDGTWIIAARKRQTASELAFYLPGHPVTYRWPGTDGKVRSQYELWPPPSASSMIFVAKDREAPPAEMREYCRDIRLVDKVVIRISHNRKRSFSIFRCQGLKGWPAIHGDRTEHEHSSH